MSLGGMKMSFREKLTKKMDFSDGNRSIHLIFCLLLAFRRNPKDIVFLDTLQPENPASLEQSNIF